MFKAKNGSNILNLRFYGYKCLIQAHKAHSNMLKLALAYGHDQVFTFFSHYFFYKKKTKKNRRPIIIELSFLKGLTRKIFLNE